MSIIECALPECYHHKSQQNSFRGTLSSFALNKYKIISQKGKCAKSKFTECNSTSRSRNMNHSPFLQKQKINAQYIYLYITYEEKKMIHLHMKDSD